MSLEQLKRTIARVEIEGRANGTAFLVDRNHVATALHVLDRHRVVDLVFPEWPKRTQKRRGTLRWRHPAGFDVAILELDSECPADITPVPWMTAAPIAGDQWESWGFPSQVTDGHTMRLEVRDPAQRIDAWDLRVLQLTAPDAQYDLGGMSGAPCMISGAIAGVITHQLYRSLSGGDVEKRPEPSLCALYALPITLFFAGPLVPPVFELDDSPTVFEEMVRMAEMLAPVAKASVLAKILRALDGARGRLRKAQRASIARRLGAATRLVVHVIWRDGNDAAAQLAQDVYSRLTRSALANTSPGVRVPTFLHSKPTFLSDAEPRPIDPARVEHSIIVLLLDDVMFHDGAWRDCHDRIVALSERDIAGTSVLPVGVDGSKRAAPFSNMRVSDLTGPAHRERLLVALEVHLLMVLAKHRTDAKDKKYVRLFLSYATADGQEYSLALRDVAMKTRGVEALLDESELGPGDRFKELLKILPGSVFVAIVTDRYSSRSWCRRELLEAKRLGLPGVVVDVQGGDDPRSFPYLGNMPRVKWRRDFHPVHTVIEAAVFAALTDTYARLLLEDQTLLDPSLRGAFIVTKLPELFDVVEGGLLSQVAQHKKPVILHPDPPLSDEEQEILSAFVPGIRVVSPGLALAEARPLRPPGVGQPLRIALSASPPDLFHAGLNHLHFEDAWLDLIRMLLLGGANLAFGGDLREGGVTDLLLEIAEQRAEFERRNKEKEGAAPVRSRPPPPIRSYLAWPANFDLTDKRITQLCDQVEFVIVPPPASSVAIYPPTKVSSDTPETRYLWARSLTLMRRTVLQDVDAIVVVGGKCTGYAGRYAGIIEESLLAIQQGKPVFVIGGLGGAAEAVGEAILGKRPVRLTSGFQLDSKLAPGEIANVEYYNVQIGSELEADLSEPIDHEDVIEAFHRAGLRGFAGLNNGLSKDENLLLLTSPSMQEVVPLILKGLQSLRVKNSAECLKL